MRIVVASSGRSHLLDCARELLNQGHDVHFFSYTTHKNMKRYGFPKCRFHSLFWVALPFLLVTRFFHIDKMWWGLRWVVDQYVSINMPACDVFIGQSPYYKKSFIKAKNKYNATTILDRGSTHVLYFEEKLRLYSNHRFSEMYKEFEINSYSIVDYIAVGSSYVKDSFLKYNNPFNKLFVNNYGCSLKSFHPTVLSETPYDLIFVGGWSKRKGCDVLSQLLEEDPELTLLHVGSVVDTPIPSLPNIKHVEAVPEYKLIDYYSQARVFILLSYDEGLALVQLQAVACGLPLVITKNTGGLDIQANLENPNYINVIKSYDMKDIKCSVDMALEMSRSQSGERKYTNLLDAHFSWGAYGARYNAFLKESIKRRKSQSQ